jgi:hypothetical protein
MTRVKRAGKGGGVGGANQTVLRVAAGAGLGTAGAQSKLRCRDKKPKREGERGRQDKLRTTGGGDGNSTHLGKAAGASANKSTGMGKVPAGVARHAATFVSLGATAAAGNWGPRAAAGGVLLSCIAATLEEGGLRFSARCVVVEAAWGLSRPPRMIAVVAMILTFLHSSSPRSPQRTPCLAAR